MAHCEDCGTEIERGKVCAPCMTKRMFGGKPSPGSGRSAGNAASREPMSSAAGQGSGFAAGGPVMSRRVRESATSQGRDGIIVGDRFARFAAFLLDTLIITIAVYLLILVGVLTVFLGFLSGAVSGLGGENLFVAMIVGAVAGILISSLITLFFAVGYNACFESSRWQATPGKLLLGIYVTDLAGNRLSFLHALWRQIPRFLPMIGAFIGLGICTVAPIVGALILVVSMLSYLWIYPSYIFNQLGQGVHDQIARTVVQERRAVGRGLQIVVAIVSVVLIILLSGNGGSQRLKQDHSNFDSRAPRASEQLLSDSMAKGLERELQGAFDKLELPESAP